MDLAFDDELVENLLLKWLGLERDQEIAVFAARFF